MAIDESFLVTGGLDHTIKVWDLNRSRTEITLKGHKDWVKFTLISKDRNKIFSISDDCKVASWVIPKFDNQIKFPHSSRFSRLDSVGPSILALTPSFIESYDMYSLKKVQEYPLEGIKIISYSYNLLRDKIFMFAIVSDINKFLVWDLITGTILQDLEINTQAMYSGIIFPNEELIAVGQNIRVTVLNLSNMEVVKTFRNHKTNVIALAVTHNNLKLFSAESNFVQYYDAVELKPIGGFVLENAVNFMQTSRDDEYLFVSAGTVLIIYTIRRLQKIYEINDFKSSKLIFTLNNQVFIYSTLAQLVFKDLSNFDTVSSVKLNHKITEFTISEDESLLVCTDGTNSTIFSNPYECQQLSIFGDWENTYDYIDYIQSLSDSKAEYDSKYDYWIIQPFKINTLHLYAYYNHSELLKTAVANHSPFFLSRTRQSPLDIALQKNFVDCVEAIYDSLKFRLKNGDQWAFYHIGNSLIKLNYSGFQNLHVIYDLGMRRCNDPTLPQFCDESIPLPHVITSSSPVTDPKEFSEKIFVDEGIAVAIAQSSFRISMNIGSQESVDLLESLIACPNEKIYSTKLVQMILREKWKVIKILFMIQALIYFIYLLTLGMYSTFFYDNILFLIIPLILSSLLSWYEIVQIKYERLEYFKDVWNYVDIIRGVSMFLYFTLAIFGANQKEIYTLLILFSWLRGITYFRVFDKTRYLIKLIMEATVDIVSFFIILFYSTLAFALIYNSMGESDENGEKMSFEKDFITSFKLNLGDFSEKTDTLLGLTIFIAVSIINPVIMLNLLISIMSDTYNRVKQSSIVADSRELASMCLELEGIMGWRRTQNEVFYIKMVCEESELDVQDNSPIGKIKTLREKVRTLIKTVNATTTEILDSITSTKDSIISSIN